MEDQSLDNLEAKVRHLVAENAKLKKTNLWLGAFVVMAVIIQVYNLVARYLNN
jgi:hypothetical protein